MKLAVGALTFAIATVFAAWWWLGLPVAMPASPLSQGDRLQCVSYAPFRPDQSPLVDGTYVEARQIDEDLARLAKVTNCVRT
jgi:hypothetical protein